MFPNFQISKEVTESDNAMECEDTVVVQSKIICKQSVLLKGLSQGGTTAPKYFRGQWSFVLKQLEM